MLWKKKKKKKNMAPAVTLLIIFIAKQRFFFCNQAKCRRCLSKFFDYPESPRRLTNIQGRSDGPGNYWRLSPAVLDLVSRRVKPESQFHKSIPYYLFGNFFHFFFFQNIICLLARLIVYFHGFIQIDVCYQKFQWQERKKEGLVCILAYQNVSQNIFSG